MPKTTKKITTIPATLTRFTATPITEQKKRLVAGYARVSTDHDDQFTSYEAQIDYYTNYIKSRDDWEFVDVYTDAGITGTSTKHREGFKRMVADALAGKIDLIVTKSVSRFARNTVDSLTTIRQLKENGIECYFEKEKAKARLDVVTDEIHQMQTQRASIEDFLSAFAAMPDELAKFTLESWHGLVDYGTVYAADDIRFTFKNGQEVKA